MNAEQLAAWLIEHGWAVESVELSEVIAEHPERGRRRFTMRITQGKLVGDTDPYWHIEKLPARRTGAETP